MSEQRKIAVDYAQLDQKILQDDDEYLVMPAVIASEIVHEYDNGWAYKPADELEKAAWTAEGRWVKILSHPDTMFIERQDDIYGKMENPRFVKNLKDPKTGRPMRRGIKADIRWFKKRCPPDVIEKIKSGALRDVSIGFTYVEDPTKGTWNGLAYDYIQRDIFIDHLAAPIPAGRCPGPICGIAVDNILRKKAGDPWEETEEHIRSGHRSPPEGGECRTKVLSESEGIKAVICDYGEEGWQIQSYLFSKQKGWTLEKAKSWYNSHKDRTIDELEQLINCTICKAIEDVGLLEASKRLSIAYGKDVLYVIKGKPPKKAADNNLAYQPIHKTSLDEDFQKAFGELKQHLNSQSPFQ